MMGDSLVGYINTDMLIPTPNGTYFPTQNNKVDLSQFKGMSLLDLGSGFGDFVEYALSEGLDAKGIEINPFFFNHSKVQNRITLGDMLEMDWDADILFYYMTDIHREDEFIEKLNHSEAIVIINTGGIPKYFADIFKSKLTIDPIYVEYEVEY